MPFSERSNFSSHLSAVKYMQDFYESWIKALKSTEIIRPRIQHLSDTADTRVPYIFLAPSEINVGDTIARNGEVIVSKPELILPPHVPLFDGFDFESEQGSPENHIINFLLIRGIQLPSMRYSNSTSSLEVFEGGLKQAVAHNLNQLQRQENVQTGLITGLEDGWQFSVLIYICTQIVRNAERDIQRLREQFRNKERP